MLGLLDFILKVKDIRALVDSMIAKSSEPRIANRINWHMMLWNWRTKQYTLTNLIVPHSLFHPRKPMIRRSITMHIVFLKQKLIRMKQWRLTMAPNWNPMDCFIYTFKASLLRHPEGPAMSSVLNLFSWWSPDQVNSNDINRSIIIWKI